MTAWAMAVGAGLYLAWFASIPLVDESSRGEILANRLLLFDDDIANWFGQPAEFSLLDRAAPMALAAGTIGFAMLLGAALVRAFRWNNGLSRGESLLTAAAVGLNSLSLLTLLAGLAGRLDRTAAILPAIMIGACALAYSLRRRRANSSTPPALSEEPEDEWLSAKWAWLGAPFLLIVLLAGVTPSADFDVLEYHLQAPKEFYLQRRVGFLPHNVYANMPLGVEMHTLWAMVVCDDWRLGALAGKLVTAMFVPLTALSLWTMGGRMAGRSAGLAAGLVFFSVPLVLQTATAGMIDAGAALYWWLAWTAVWRWRQSRTAEPACDNTAPISLAGFLAGSAVACKYPGALFVVVPLAAWTAWEARKTKSAGVLRTAFPTAIFLLAAAIACAPWFIKNWALSGSPTYPLLGTIFGGETRTPERIAQWDAAHRPSDYSVQAVWREAKVVLGGAQLHSPLIVPLAVAAIWSQRQRRLVRAIAAYLTFVMAAWWLATHRIDRFWLPALPFAAMLAGIGATQAAQWARQLILALIVVGLLSILIVANTLLTSDMLVALDKLWRHPQRVDPWTRAFNDNELSAERILIVGRADVFNFQSPILYNTVFDECLIEAIGQGRTPAEVHAQLQELGVSHVLVDWTWVERYRAPGNYGFTDYVQPEVFQTWVEAGVLAPALPRRQNWRGEELPVDVFPVRPIPR